MAPTETLAELTVNLDLPRWEGVPFLLRTGKGLGRERKEAVVAFRGGDVLRVGLEPATVQLGLGGVELGGGPTPAPLPAYAQVLLAALDGDLRRAVRADEAVQSWRVVEPVLEAWAAGQVPLLEYPAGSTGPT